jgi:fructose/tagatose bisphosphate aldolase
VPVAVTDLAAAPVILYSLPLNVSSLQNLIQTFANIQMQVEAECGNESTEDTKSNTASDQSQTDMANTGSDATENGLPDRCSHLPQPGPDQRTEEIR